MQTPHVLASQPFLLYVTFLLIILLDMILPMVTFIFSNRQEKKVFLTSLKNHNRNVALAIVVSCDPKFKLDDAKITNEFLVVHVDMALVKTEDSVRSRKNCNSW